MPLGSRVSKGLGCDVFLSVHINSVESPQAHGTEVLYNTDSKLAMLVATGISESLGTRLRGAIRSPKKAVLQSRIPSLLIEIAFLSNANDFKIITDEHSPIKVAQAMATALESWQR
jgi:N-acetylmuramoyl-L-alanine amidase